MGKKFILELGDVVLEDMALIAKYGDKSRKKIMEEVLVAYHTKQKPYIDGLREWVSAYWANGCKDLTGKPRPVD